MQHTLECILTKPCLWNNTSLAFAALCFLHSGDSHLTRLDYCNATFAGVANEQIVHIQKIQNLNNTVQLLLKKLKRAHVTPLFKELHWLPVKYCIQYKLAALTFCHFDITLPLYLSSSLCTYQPLCSLHSSTEQLLKIHTDKLENQ